MREKSLKLRGDSGLIAGVPLESTAIRLEDEMYDVIAVNMTTHKVRMLGENKTERNADAIEMMAVARLGCDEEFFTKTPAGKYKEGDEWDESSEDV